jgi:uncharacterized membrane protein (DUF373 family)
MSDLQVESGEQDDKEYFNQSAKGKIVHEHVDRIAIFSVNLLDRADTYVYAIVGVCFLLGTLFALGYSFWDFSISLMLVPGLKMADQPAAVVGSIIKLISDLLLVLIITEVLGTVIHYLKEHVTSLRPFLFIGIISATRGILSISAKLSVGKVDNFNEAMIELGVHAAVVLALGITLKLLGRNLEIGPDI